MTRDDGGAFSVVVAVFALAWGVRACLPPGETWVEQRSDDLWIPTAPTEAGEEGQVPAGPIAPADASQCGGCVSRTPVHLPRPASSPAVAYRVHVTSRLVHAARNEDLRLVLRCVGARDVDGDVREFDRASGIVRGSEVRDKGEEDGEDLHGTAQ